MSMCKQLINCRCGAWRIECCSCNKSSFLMKIPFMFTYILEFISDPLNFLYYLRSVDFSLKGLIIPQVIFTYENHRSILNIIHENGYHLRKLTVKFTRKYSTLLKSVFEKADNLKYLDISKCSINLNLIRTSMGDRISNLHVLKLGKSKFIEESLSTFLKAAVNLVHLDVSSCKFVDKSLLNLSKTCEILNISKTKVSEDTLSIILLRLKNLVSLNVKGLQVNESLEHITETCEVLDISKTNVSEETLNKVIPRLKELKSLKVEDLYVNTCLKDISDKCELLNITNTLVSPDTLEFLLGEKNLKDVVFTHFKFIDPKGSIHSGYVCPSAFDSMDEECGVHGMREYNQWYRVFMNGFYGYGMNIGYELHKIITQKAGSTKVWYHTYIDVYHFEERSKCCEHHDYKY